jgi:hypothetical protein
MKKTIRVSQQKGPVLDISTDMIQPVLEKLVQIVVDFHWMARRYCDGRSTYAPHLLNEHVRVLQQMGIELNPTGDNAVFARDGAGRVYDKLPEDAVRLAEHDDLRYTLLEAIEAWRAKNGNREHIFFTCMCKSCGELRHAWRKVFPET